MLIEIIKRRQAPQDQQEPLPTNIYKAALRTQLKALDYIGGSDNLLNTLIDLSTSDSSLSNSEKDQDEVILLTT